MCAAKLDSIVLVRGARGGTSVAIVLGLQSSRAYYEKRIGRTVVAEHTRGKPTHVTYPGRSLKLSAVLRLKAHLDYLHANTLVLPPDSVSLRYSRIECQSSSQKVPASAVCLQAQGTIASVQREMAQLPALAQTVHQGSEEKVGTDHR